MKRVFSLILALLMVCGVLASCSSKDSEESQSAVGGYDENGYIMDNLGTMNFEGKEIVISGWTEIQNNGFPEYACEKNGELLSEAGYARNLSVESRMNVNLTYRLESGHTAQDFDKPQVASVRNAAGTNDINLIATYSWNPAMFLVNGYLGDMSSMPNLNLEAPWWNQSILEKNSIYGKVYFATGDIAPSFIGVTYGVFFNKQLVEDFHLDEPYELYQNGTWTIDKMIQLSKKIGVDLNNNGNKDDGDRFGFATYQVATDAFLQDSGILTVENEADGSLKIGKDFGTEKAQTNAKLLVMSPFLFGHESKAHFIPDLERRLPTIRKITAEYADVYVPLDTMVAQALKTQSEPYFYSADGVHPNPNGAELIGKIYAEAVKPLIESI